jgi:hypothetical protein
MNYQAFLRRRRIGAIALIGAFIAQSLFGVFCGNLFGFWQTTLILVVPPAFFLLISGSIPSLWSTGILVPFVVIANLVECAPYRGGGAAMGYVPAFILGLPLSFLVGVCVSIYVLIRERKAKREH